MYISLAGLGGRGRQDKPESKNVWEENGSVQEAVTDGAVPVSPSTIPKYIKSVCGDVQVEQNLLIL